MAGASPPRRPVGVWVVVAVLLAASLVGTLWVPFYARTTPAIGGFPFFYWYQLLWVPIVAALSLIAYLLIKPARRGGTGAHASSADSPGATTGGEGS